MFPTASVSISGLLSTPFLLNVPLYQRPFSWGEDEAEQLFDDLVEMMNVDEPDREAAGYFLGTILLMDGSNLELPRLSAKMPLREFDVVDGQQRLITLMTMFAVMRDLEAASQTSSRRPIARRVQGFLLAQMGNRFFRTERFRLHAQGRDREFFEEYVLPAGSTQALPVARVDDDVTSLLMVVRNRLRVLLGDMSEDDRDRLFAFVADRAHVVVIISNDIDRAHRMFVVLNERGKKLQRNDILKADVLSRLPSMDIDWASKKWDEVGAMLGEDFERFFAHLRVIYGYTRPQIVSGVRAIVRDAGGAEVFFKSVFVPLARAYASIRHNRDEVLPPALARHLQYLNRMSDGDWAPAAMLVMKDWRRDPARATALIGEIERLAHLMRLLCAGTGKRVRRFADVIEAIRTTSDIDASHAVFQLSREEARSIAFHLKDLHKRNAKACKLLLLRLSDEIDGHVSNVDCDAYTIEHVLPQRPAATSEWRRWFPAAEERARATESLGNLVLITQQQNDRARNASWSAKKEIYAANSARAPLLAITDDVLEVAEWRFADVDAREQRMIEMIDRIWRTDFSSVRRAITKGDSPEASPLTSQTNSRPLPN